LAAAEAAQIVMVYLAVVAVVAAPLAFMWWLGRALRPNRNPPKPHPHVMSGGHESDSD